MNKFIVIKCIFSFTLIIGSCYWN
uniref:Lipoprotein n=1 Tax=Heterorhabditis bacteriophora TaxID=37862 RepID=A0A1I7W820_HETBA